MDFERHRTDLKAQRRANRTLGAIVGALAVGQLLSLATIVSILGSERTVVVPPTIDRTFWVTRDNASREYLEEMAGFVAWLVLDVTPATVDWKRNVLLNYVAPEQHAQIKTRMDLEAERLRRNNASTSFLIQQFTANEKDQSVVVTGRLRRQVNGSDVGEPETRAYLAQFQYTGGRVHIKTFKEIPNGPNAPVRMGDAGPDAVAR
jgi:conjugal transfer pilus assembly protein TraE